MSTWQYPLSQLEIETRKRGRWGLTETVTRKAQIKDVQNPLPSNSSYIVPSGLGGVFTLTKKSVSDTLATFQVVNKDFQEITVKIPLV